MPRALPALLLLLLPLTPLLRSQPAPAAPAPAPAATPATGTVDGRKLFLKNCAPCHGPDGKARSPAARKLGVKDLTVNTLPADRIRVQIREGVQAGGGSGKMPAFKEAFSDPELAALVAEVLAFRPPQAKGTKSP